MNKKATFILSACIAISGIAIMQAHTSEGLNKEVEENQGLVPQTTPLRRGVNASRKDENPAGVKYILFGKSMFDADHNNVYASGGYNVKYAVYADIDETAKTAALTNLIDVTGLNPIPANGSYNPDTHEISFAAPMLNSRIGECQQIGTYSDDEKIFLRAGNPYGIGYLDKVNGLTLKVSDDFSKITPQSGMYASCAEYYYDEDDEDWYWNVTINYLDVIYDAVLLRQVEGVSFASNVDQISFDDTYVDKEYTKSFLLYNVGSESSDYVVESSDPAFTLVDDSGEIGSENFKEITVKFSPTEVRKYDATLTIQSEGEAVTINLSADVSAPIDYNDIVVAGNFSFDTGTPEYPWKIKEIDGKKVAISSNAGVGKTNSDLQATCTIGDGKVGKLSWKGLCDARFRGYDDFCVILDGEEVYSTESSSDRNIDISNTINLSPGTHTVAFTYEKSLFVESVGYDYGDDYAYIYDLKLEEAESAQAIPEVDSDRVDLGKIYIDGISGNTASADVVLTNTGYGQLEVLGIEAGDPFSASVDKTTIGSLETLTITVTAAATTEGTVNNDVVIKTNGGDVTLSCSITGLTMPDFSSIVSQGTFYFETDPNNPFMVRYGKAFNANSNDYDEEESLSYLIAYFYVPNGKVGRISWNGECSTQELAMGSDAAFIMVDESIETYYGECKASPIYFYPEQVLNISSGSHMVVFGYSKNGDGQNYGDDRLSVSELSLTLLDATPDTEVTLWRDDNNVDFGTVNVGDYNYEKINIANTGASSFQITDVDADDGFVPVADTETDCTSFAVLTNYIKFVPTESKVYEGTVTFHTTAGDVVINCKGTGVSMKDYLLFEDFEDEVEGWTFIERGTTFDIGWTQYTDGKYAHTGNGYIKSSSCTFCDDVDNLAISPEITIPESGATLQYFVGETYHDCGDEIYEVYFGSKDDLDSAELLLTETLSGDDYVQKEISLDALAGKTGSIIFRHCTDNWYEYILLDDISVKANSSSVNAIIGQADVVNVEYFNINGIRVSAETSGLVIRKTTYSDGSIRVEKIVK